MRYVPSGDVALRNRCGEDGYYVCEQGEYAQYPLGQVRRLPSAWSAAGEDQDGADGGESLSLILLAGGYPHYGQA